MMAGIDDKMLGFEPSLLSGVPSRYKLSQGDSRQAGHLKSESVSLESDQVQWARLQIIGMEVAVSPSPGVKVVCS